jgi:hypothetical protein
MNGKTIEELDRMYDWWSGGFHIDAPSNMVGMAIAEKDGKKFHITIDGRLVYKQRYLHVGDFHQGLAIAIAGSKNCFHIRTDGKPAYKQRYDDVWSLQHGLAFACKNGYKFHIRPNGTRVK